MSAPKNAAAWIKAPHAQLEVDEAPWYEPKEGEVLVKVHAVSIQPVDWKIQAYDFFVKEYPFILGTDSAGTVEAIGAGVTHVKKGDRVLAHHQSLGTGNPRDSSFQHYAIAPGSAVSPIPSSLTFEQATVLPLALSTAADGLYQPDLLALPLPKPDAPNPEGNGKTLLVWGGSSSVGAAAVQLGVASGFRVVATASPANFEFVKSLGASAVFDYRSSTVADDLIAELKKDGEEFAGAYDAISENGSVELVAKVVSLVGGRQFIATTLPPPKDLPEGVKAAGVLAPNVVSRNNAAIAKAIYHDFVPRALETGALQAKPEPLPVEGKGLEAVQSGLDRQKEGVSARKVVVRIL
ncbi:hypothetical protein JCM10207_006295 [Rhodosporidiobolus poonsookiae]